MMFPTDWYWVADDGRVFASGRQALVDINDESYREAEAAGQVTRWPADELGAQTEATLQAVLDTYGLVVSLHAYALKARWQAEVAGITAGGIPVATDDRSKMMILGSRVAAMADPAWSTTWAGTDGGSYPIDAAAMIAISDAVQAHVNSVFATFAAVKIGIAAGAITTTGAVDAAFADGGTSLAAEVT